MSPDFSYEFLPGYERASQIELDRTLSVMRTQLMRGGEKKGVLPPNCHTDGTAIYDFDSNSFSIDSIESYELLIDAERLRQLDPFVRHTLYIDEEEVRLNYTPGYYLDAPAEGRHDFHPPRVDVTVKPNEDFPGREIVYTINRQYIGQCALDGFRHVLSKYGLKPLEMMTATHIEQGLTDMQESIRPLLSNESLALIELVHAAT